jgi:hypothetical protein
MATNSKLSTWRRATSNPHYALFVMAALLLLAVPGRAVAQNNHQENNCSGARDIQGSWIFTIDRFTQGVTFTALMSFTDGGVVLATGSLDRLPPPPISPLYGSWKCTEPRRFVATFFFFAFDPQGNAVAMIKNNVSLHLNNRNQIRGTGEAFACDVHGENCVNVHSPIHLKGNFIVPEGVGEESGDN